MVGNVSLTLAVLVYHKVDVQRPEMNREVFIYQSSRITCKDDKGKDMFASGYLLAMPVNPKWIKLDQSVDWWTLSVYCSHQLNLKIPAWAFELIYDRDAFANGLDDPNLLESLDGHHHRYSEDVLKSQRTFYTILLDFPNDHMFDATMLDKDSNGDIKGKLTPSFEMVKGKKKVKGYFWTWKIVTTHISANKKGKIEEEKTATKSAAAEMLASLEQDMDGVVI